MVNVENDRIERSVTIGASAEKVWEVLTSPEHVGTWFGTGRPIPIDLRPGGEMVLDHGSNGHYRTVFVEVDRPHRLSYRWAEGYPDVLATEASSTLVEFTITSISERESNSPSSRAASARSSFPRTVPGFHTKTTTRVGPTSSRRSRRTAKVAIRRQSCPLRDRHSRRPQRPRRSHST